MKRKGIAARIAAAVLAVGMVVADVTPALAAETTAASAEADVEQDKDINGSVNGVSKVIGLEVEASKDTKQSDDGSVILNYIKPYYDDYHSSVTVSGKKEDFVDKESGLYKYGNDFYANAYVSGSTVKLSSKVAWHCTVDRNATSAEKSAAKAQLDEDTGLYRKNGKLYSLYLERSVYETNESGTKTWVRTTYYSEAHREAEFLCKVSLKSYDEDELYRQAESYCGKKLKDSDTDYAYYEVGGKLYSQIELDKSYVYYGEGKEECRVHGIYVHKQNEISLNQCYHKLSWRTVTNDTEVDSNGTYLNVGYQIRVNGQVIALDKTAMNGTENQTFTTDHSYIVPIARNAGEAANYEVRAVYYTSTDKVTRNQQTQQEEVSTENKIVKTGAWSDVCNYLWQVASKKVPTVTNLTYTQRSAKVAEITWDKIEEATSYKIEYTYSVEPLADAAEIEKQFEKSKNTGYTSGNNPYYTLNNSDYGTTTITGADGSSQKVPYKYAYVRVIAYVNDDDESYISSMSEASNCICIAKNEVANTPAINNLRVENQTDGSFHLKWNSIDKNAKVRVYYSTDKNVFGSQYYLYSLIDAEGIDNNGTATTADDKRVSLVDAYSMKDQIRIANKKVNYVNCSNGTNEVSSDDMSLDVGEKYYFVVVTYDTLNKSIDRSATTPYIANVSCVAGETRNVAYGYYNDVVTSKMVSGKAQLEIEQPSTTSGKTSIAMTFERSETKCSGFEIYRKNGKKYKKIATTNSAYYKDENLKQNTVYDYKVRAYYYNPDTKAKAYSNYIFFSAETGTSNNIKLKIEKKSKTSVKLGWTKVPGATRYEIYRSNTASTDTVYSQKNGYGNGEYALSNAKWSKVKTIKKAGTTSYTDKKLKSGETYSYRVVAYYKSGKKEKCIFASDSIALELTTPRDVNAVLSGTSVKVTWKKETYASKYEVSYIKSNAEGVSYTDDWVRATTKKSSYTIKNVGAGESVKIRLRAYGGKQWSSYSITITEKGKQLAAVKKITAKEITETNTSGKKTTAVKISWNKVSGAAYYKVYRSMTPNICYSAERGNYDGPQGVRYFISKEGNADENNSYCGYKEYKGQNGTVVGTSAVDRARLRTGVTYYYYVCAFSRNGEQISDGYTKAASICYKATPSIKKITAKKGKTIISINKVSGAKKYVIYRSTKKNSGYKKVGTTTKTTYTDKTTKKGKTYYYKVVAVGKNALKADFESNKSKAVKVKAK